MCCNREERASKGLDFSVSIHGWELTLHLVSKVSDLDTASSYTISDDAVSLRSHRTGRKKSYHAS